MGYDARDIAAASRFADESAPYPKGGGLIQTAAVALITSVGLILYNEIIGAYTRASTFAPFAIGAVFGLAIHLTQKAKIARHLRVQATELERLSWHRSAESLPVGNKKRRLVEGRR